MSHLIAIAGPSCAGKTELAKRISAALGAPILPIDAYYRDLHHLSFPERCQFNFDEPAALDEALLQQHVKSLAAGIAIDRPTYDFTVHARAAATEHIVPGAFIILEGLFALYWDDIRPFLGTKVYVDAPDDICLARRTLRDVRERGRTPQSVLAQYEKTVRPMAQLYVRPTARWADIVVSGEQPLELSAQTVLRRIQPERSLAVAASPHV